ncbi:MAG TPA: M15 family metallopeptidase [Clostridiales bacterium]|jgi:peptidoglycan L-alanyl-D-glutamate endopeptidase CwlK|nr:M15 family metallopeptidase [Clostridiales bacterium]
MNNQTVATNWRTKKRKRRWKNWGLLLLIMFVLFGVFPKAGVYAYFFDRGSYQDKYLDSETIVTDLDELSPKTKELAIRFLERCAEEGLPVKITETYRSQERQNKLYEQGRTQPGAVVTWTKNSRHTDRRAFDICKQGSDPYGDEEFFRRCAEIGREVGLSPGYYWKEHPDKPHYELKSWWL